MKSEDIKFVGTWDAYEKGRKAGIKEVVDTYKRDNPSAYKKYEAYWQAKLKDWGFDG